MDFNPLSKIWIYQSNRAFTIEESAVLTDILNSFTKTWTAHNQQLKAGYEIKYNRFIILIVDETQAGASGCSIDKSVHLMKDIEQQLNINLFDRFQVAWKEDSIIKTADRSEFELLIEQGKVNGNTIVFNNLVENLEEFRTSWETPLKNSWHSKVFTV